MKVKEKKITKVQLKKLERKEIKLKDKEWADAVKKRDGYRCIFCGSSFMLNAAHIFPREIKEFRWDIDDGVSACPKHHKFSFELSMHQNPLAALLVISNTRTEQFTRLVYKWGEYLENGKKQ